MAMLEAEEDDGEKENNWYNWIELIRLHKMNSNALQWETSQWPRCRCCGLGKLTREV